MAEFSLIKLSDILICATMPLDVNDPERIT